MTRGVLPLVLRGNGLRADAMSGVLDDVPSTSGQASSSVLHAVCYRGPIAAHARSGRRMVCSVCQRPVVASGHSLSPNTQPKSQTQVRSLLTVRL